jgi:hypothetical protein
VSGQRTPGGWGVMDELTRCAGITRAGGRCTHSAREGQTFCHHHDPARAEQRSKTASKAATAKNQASELVQDRTRLKEIAEGCLAGTITTARASVAAQVYGVRARYFEQERRERELEELAREVGEIKDMLSSSRQDRRDVYG